MRDKTIKSVTTNWFYSTGESGEQYSFYTVGKNKVVDIEYHEPKGEGDAHYCDISFEDGAVVRKFNIDEIIFNP